MVRETRKKKGGRKEKKKKRKSANSDRGSVHYDNNNASFFVVVGLFFPRIFDNSGGKKKKLITYATVCLFGSRTSLAQSRSCRIRTNQNYVSFCLPSLTRQREKQNVKEEVRGQRKWLERKTKVL